jgi:L-Ala-D/L-Glu epimerase
MNFEPKQLNYKQAFATSGYSAGTVAVARVQLADSTGRMGWGESSPRAYVNQSIDDVLHELAQIAQGADAALMGGSTRFALSTAQLDLAAKQQKTFVWQVAGIDTVTALKPCATAYTLSLDTPQNMAQQAQDHAHFKTLKLKIDADLPQNIARLKAIKNVAPHAAIYLDANQAMASEADLAALVAQTNPLGVQLVEQPFAKGSVLEKTLQPRAYSIPIFADESCVDAQNLDFLARHYDGINIKLDKCGGLLAAQALAQAALDKGLQLMVGCMGASSLSIYPALLLANQFDIKFVDLDGAYLTIDDTNFVIYKNGTVTINRAAFEPK